MIPHLRMLSVLFFFAGNFYSVSLQAQENADIPVPNERQLRWQQAEFGVVFHYDLHVFDGNPYDYDLHINVKY